MQFTGLAKPTWSRGFGDGVFLRIIRAARTNFPESAWTVPRFNVPPVRLIKESIRSSWKHLQDLEIPAVSTEQIGLLIEVQVVQSMIQHEWRQGQKVNSTL